MILVNGLLNVSGRVKMSFLDEWHEDLISQAQTLCVCTTYSGIRSHLTQIKDSIAEMEVELGMLQEDQKRRREMKNEAKP